MKKTKFKHNHYYFCTKDIYDRGALIFKNGVKYKCSMNPINSGGVIKTVCFIRDITHWYVENLGWLKYFSCRQEQREEKLKRILDE